MALNIQKSFQYQPVLNRSGSDHPSSGIGGGSTPITESSTCTMFDNGLTLINSTVSDFTKTIPVNIGTDFGFAMIQASTGTCTIAAGTGVTFIGSLMATSSVGGIVAAIWIAPNTYVIKVN
jgi:hypothetical protein